MVSHPPRRHGAQFRPGVIAACLYFQLIVICLLPSAARAAPDDAITKIEPVAGWSLTRPIATNAVHSFEVDLQPGLFLHLTIEKGDLGVSVRVIGSQREILREQISYSSGRLSLPIVAETKGTVMFEIRSLEQDDAVRDYRLTIAEVRPARPADVKFQAAATAFGLASKLRNNNDNESLRNALTKYQEAEALWIAAGDFGAAAHAAEGAAAVHFILGDYRRALAAYQSAANENRRAGDRSREFAAIGEQAILHSYLGENDTAEGLVTLAVAYFRKRSNESETDNTRRYAKALEQLGEIAYSQGNLSRALEALQQSLLMFEKLKERDGQAQARLFIGYTNATFGEEDTALGEFEKAQALFTAVRDLRGRALCTTAIGSIHSRRGEMQTALKQHRQALEDFRKLGDSQSEAIGLISIGQVYEHVNEKDLALANYHSALESFKKHGAVDFAISTTYQIAQLHKSRGDIRNAISFYRECLRMSAKAKKRRIQAYALNDMAAIFVSEGKRDEAVRQYRRVLSFYRTINDKRGETLALNALGDLYASLNNLKKALSFYQRALESGKDADEQVQIKTLCNTARVAHRLGNVASAISYVEAAIKKIDQIRTNLAAPALRTSYRASMHAAYSLYIDLLMQQERKFPGQDFAVKALLISEMSRSRSLLEVLVESKANIQQGMDPVLSSQARALQRQLKELRIQQASLSQSPSKVKELQAFAQRFNEVKTEHDAIEGQLRESNSRYAALVQPPTLKIEDLQTELGIDDSMLLEYVIGKERSYLWAVTSDSVNAYELPPRKTIEDAASATYAALTARQNTDDQANTGYGERVDNADREFAIKSFLLSNMLLGPVAQKLGSHRLLIVADGYLHYIPFDALPDPSTGQDATGPSLEPEPLLVRHEIVMLPSISTLSTIRNEPYSPSPENLVAIVADPVFSNNDSRLASRGDYPVSVTGANPKQTSTRVATRYAALPGGAELRRLARTSDEADAIAALMPPGTALVAKGLDANRDAVIDPQFGRYQILHFATHGLLDSEHPDLSSLVLSQIDKNGQPRDGLVQLQDVYNLKLSSNLVVLSACNTALGKDVKGEGLMSLTRGFLYAGSKSVVATIWNVDDSASTELMSRFYTALLRQGLPPSAALRSSKLELRKEKRWRQPYFWAGFVFQGEYRQPVSLPPKQGYGSVWLLVLPPVVTALACYAVMKKLRRRHS